MIYSVKMGDELVASKKVDELKFQLQNVCIKDQLGKQIFFMHLNF